VKVEKKFALRVDQIGDVARGHGSCFASDRITVDGQPVGYMYRDEPVEDVDSGWVFLAGDEDQAYLDDETRTGVYDVNTIANHDGDIVPLLDTPAPCAFARASAGAPLRPAAR
jgi:hypothetical protein